MKVLSVASECAPLVKTGGLADVAGALPAALAAENVRVVTLLPGYRKVMAALGKPQEVLREPDLFGGEGRLLKARAARLDLLVLDAPHLFDRDGTPYLDGEGRDWPDNADRFAALCWMAMRVATEGAGGWRPDLLHLHDWQAALTPVYLRDRAPDPGQRPGTLLTIHNIAFHGLTPSARREALRLPGWGFHPEGYEYYGQINALKAGLVYADRLSTVSPTYARELMTPEFGMGLDGVLRARRADLSGILNGIDTVRWNPAADPSIAAPYAKRSGKAPNTAALRAELELPPADGPLCVVVSRLTWQKGIDMLIDAAPALLDGGGQLAILGAGDRSLEAACRGLADRHPGVAVRIGYDEALAHRMIAGGEAILVPSRFEPCGLTQLYGLRYGTIPLVSLTGGLADTVITANPAGLSAGVSTGIKVHPVATEALAAALSDLCALYSNRRVWARLVRNAMRQEVGWDRAARAYAGLFADTVPRP